MPFSTTRTTSTDAGTHRDDHNDFAAFHNRKTYIIDYVGTNGSTSSSTFANYPGGPSVSFTKIRSDTDIIVKGFIGAVKTTGVGSVVVGIQINSVDYTMGALSYLTLSQHMQIHVAVSLNSIADAWTIARVPTGTYTATVRWNTTTNGASTDSNDRVQLLIREEFGIA